MADDPRVARLEEQLLLERARYHEAMNRAQAEIQRLKTEVRDYRIKARDATSAMTEMQREMLELRNQPSVRIPQSEREKELEAKLESERRIASNANMKAKRVTETMRLLENELVLLATNTKEAREIRPDPNNGVYRVGMIDHESAQALTGAPITGEGPYSVLAHVHDGRALRLLVDLEQDIGEGSVPVDKFAKISELEEREAKLERAHRERLRELAASMTDAAERIRYYENAEFAMSATEGVPEANPDEKNPDGFYRIGSVGTDVEIVITDTAEIPVFEEVEHTGKGGFVDTSYGMTIAGMDGAVHPIYGEFRSGYLFRVVIDLTADFRSYDGLL